MLASPFYFSPFPSHLSEIEDFLTEQECNDIILMAQTQGLERSMTLGEQSRTNETSGNSTNAIEDIEETFKSLDSNSDGHLDVGEVLKHIYSNQRHFAQKLRAIIAF